MTVADMNANLRNMFSGILCELIKENLVPQWKHENMNFCTKTICSECAYLFSDNFITES